LISLKSESFLQNIHDSHNLNRPPGRSDGRKIPVTWSRSLGTFLVCDFYIELEMSLQSTEFRRKKREGNPNHSLPCTSLTPDRPSRIQDDSRALNHGAQEGDAHTRCSRDGTHGRLELDDEELEDSFFFLATDFGRGGMIRCAASANLPRA
jgi:hypothetical protein